MIPEPEPTAGHDSAHRPPGFSYAIFALGGLAEGLIQIGLLIAGIVVICIAIIAGAARRVMRLGRAGAVDG